MMSPAWMLKIVCSADEDSALCAWDCAHALTDDWIFCTDAAAFDHLVEGSRKHAVRRRAEMEAAVAMLEALGVEPRVSAASEAWLAGLA